MDVSSKSLHNAFSLIELSIVLVILGLLTGGILAGQSLIRAAELRSITQQATTYSSSVHTFRGKYMALPGDMNNAQSFWGIADASNCATTATNDARTCNGNGSGTIESITQSNESFRFWQHLANAGLIEGQYDGINHGSATYSSTAANSPAGRMGSTLWFVVDWNTRSGSTTVFDGVYGNVFQVGKTLANNSPALGFLKPEEAWNIDVKLDDGLPAVGKVVIQAATGLNTCTDTSSSSNLNASYLLTSTSTVCAMVFRNWY